MVEVTPAEPGTSYTVCLNRDRQRAETLRLNRDREGAEVSGDPGLLRCAMKVLSIAVFLVSCVPRSEEHTSELQSLTNLVCRLLLEKKKKKQVHRKTL